MKVILTENIEALGNIGDVVTVKDGYARNFLIPKKKAIKANPKNIKSLKHQKKIVADTMNRKKKIAEELAKKIENFSCTISRQAGEKEKLFGSVTSMDIEAIPKAEGLDVEKKQIVLKQPIKSLGLYSASIHLHTDVEAKLKIWVVKE